MRLRGWFLTPVAISVLLIGIVLLLVACPGGGKRRRILTSGSGQRFRAPPGRRVGCSRHERGLAEAASLRVLLVGDHEVVRSAVRALPETPTTSLLSLRLVR